MLNVEVQAAQFRNQNVVLVSPVVSESPVFVAKLVREINQEVPSPLMPQGVQRMVYFVLQRGLFSGYRHLGGPRTRLHKVPSCFFKE